MNICIGRQIGSGGGIIARRLAEQFACTLYDSEILNLAARESGFSEKFFEQNDERRAYIRSVFHLHLPFVSDNNFYRSEFSQESLFKFQSDAIRNAASKGPCVFVGRCADYVLRERSDVVSIFITASMDDRVKRVIRRKRCDVSVARKIIRHKENARAAYYNYYTDKRWGEADSYDLCVNTSALSINATVDFIGSFIRQRFNIQ